MSYWSEIQRLPRVWSWAAHEAEVRRLRCALHRLADGPLFVVGSGGSSAACALAARLHQQGTGRVALPVTPLEYIRTPPARGGVLLVSASGKNPDILAAARHALATAEGPVAALCLRGDSPLAELLAPTHTEALAGLEYPLAKDGFLATGTLLATVTLLARGWGAPDMPDLLPALSAPDPALDRLAGARSLVALASGWASMAAMDLESRWGEAGLGAVTALDPRNFAHGRHQGLARLASDSAVVALSTPADEEVVRGTMDLLPSSISTHRVQTPLDGPWGAVDLMVRTLTIAGAAGRHQGFDPGRPGVPDFGRKLYHQRLPRSLLPELIPADELAITRKLGQRGWDSLDATQRESWRAGYRMWASSVQQVRLGGLVLDYDGTLCDKAHRFESLPDEMARRLETLARAGLSIGVATGRGGSVHKSLRATLPEACWEQVTLGLYNGGLLVGLAEPIPPEPERPWDPAMRRVAEVLGSSGPVMSGLKIEARPEQVTVEPGSSDCDLAQLKRRVQMCLLDAGLVEGQIKIATSGHSLDILPARSGKLRVVERVRARLRAPALEILRVGDRGDVGGNDFELLASALGLSVDQVSPSSKGCWNPLPAGVSGAAGMLRILNALRAGEGFHSLDLEALR